ncbi:DUF4384 domain-containing protein [Myxococcota bacterium]|nr:DUF4384 domain-containing protein [Myxococcota bacterium]
MTSEKISEKTASCGRRIELLALHTGELPEGHPLRAHAATCARCTAILGELDREREVMLREVDVDAESRAILRRLEATERADARGAATAPTTDEPSLGARLLAWLQGPALRPALTFAALLLVAVPAVIALDRAGDETSPTGTTRTKGGAALEMYVKDAAGVRRAADGERLRAGDAIQFRYRAAGKPWLMIVSVTSSGALSPLYPETEGSSIAITPSGVHVLDGSIILDDAKGKERVLALFSDTPITWADVDAAVKRALAKTRDVATLGALDLGRTDVDQAAILFSKE